MLFRSELLQKYRVDSYISNCLTTTLPTREKKRTQTKVFVSSRNRAILDILPAHIRDECSFVNHYSNTNNFKRNMELAQKLLENYRDTAKLVITTFLHSALPCIAMGIPVIVFYPNFPSESEGWKSDRERMSTLRTMTRCYNFSEANDVNWNPDSININQTKRELIKGFNKRVRTILR